MDKKLDVKQVYKKESGDIEKVKTKDGNIYSENDVLNMVKDEVKEANIEGINNRKNYSQLVQKGITYGAKVDEDIKEIKDKD